MLKYMWYWARKSHWSKWPHDNDVIMSTMASQITSLAIVYSTIYSSADHRKPQSSASLAFVRRIHRSQMNSPHKGPVTRKMFAFDDVIMWNILGGVGIYVNDLLSYNTHGQAMDSLNRHSWWSWVTYYLQNQNSSLKVSVRGIFSYRINVDIKCISTCTTRSFNIIHWIF